MTEAKRAAPTPNARRPTTTEEDEEEEEEEEEEECRCSSPTTTLSPSDDDDDDDDDAQRGPAATARREFVVLDTERTATTAEAVDMLVRADIDAIFCVYVRFLLTWCVEREMGASRAVRIALHEEYCTVSSSTGHQTSQIRSTLHFTPYR